MVPYAEQDKSPAGKVVRRSSDSGCDSSHTREYDHDVNTLRPGRDEGYTRKKEHA
jgi:hypothetical protein